MGTATPGMAQRVASLETERVIRKVTRRLVPFCLIVFMFNMLDRVNMGFAALTMNKALGLTAATFGVAGGMYWVGSFLIEIPGNMTVSKFGARRILALVLVLWGVVATGTAFVRNATDLYAIRLLLGLAEGTCWPALLLYFTLWIPESHRARVNSKFMLSLPLTNMLAFPLSAAIMGNLNGAWGMGGWKWLFIAEGFPPVLFGIIAYYYLTARPSEAKWLTESERNLLQQAIDSGQKVPVKKHEGLLTAFRDPICYVFGFGWFGIAFMMSAITMFLPLLVRQLGYKHFGTIAVIAALPFVGGIIAMLYWGNHSDKKRERMWHAAGAALFGGAAWIGAAAVHSPVAQIIFIVLATMGMYGAQCTFWALPQGAFPKELTAVGLAIVTAEGQLGGLLGPIIVGKLRVMTGGYRYGYVAIMCALVITAVASIAGTMWGRARQAREATGTHATSAAMASTR